MDDPADPPSARDREVEVRLAALAQRSVRARDGETALRGLVEDSARLLGASRACLLRLRTPGGRAETVCETVCEWPPAGGGAAAARPEAIVSRIPWLIDRLQAMPALLVPDLQGLPAEAAGERELLAAFGPGAALLLSLHAEGQLAGFFVAGGPATLLGTLAEAHEAALAVVAALLSSALRAEIVLETLEERVADRARQVAALFDITMLASQSESLADVMEPAVSRIMEIGQCQAVCIHLLESGAAEATGLRLLGQRGITQVRHSKLHWVAASEPFAAWLREPNDPIVAPDVAVAARLPAELRLPGHKAYLGAQLRARGKPQGLLSCFRAGNHPFSWNDVSILVALAEQLGVIVENQRLHRQAEQVAVVEERQRLARELHDAVSQSLYSLTLFARAARQAAEDADAVRLSDHLAALEDSGLHALREMRLLLYQLQPLALEDEGLGPALERRFNSVERRLGIRVDYSVEGHLDLPENVEAEVYRIVVEALNNSLRHARASSLAVQLRASAGCLAVRIADDGCGFDTRSPSNGMGLRNMAERARLLGGHLAVTSQPGAGTQVIFEVTYE